MEGVRIHEMGCQLEHSLCQWECPNIYPDPYIIRGPGPKYIYADVGDHGPLWSGVVCFWKDPTTDGRKDEIDSRAIQVQMEICNGCEVIHYSIMMIEAGR